MSTIGASSAIAAKAPEWVGGLRVLMVCPEGIDATGELAGRIDRFVNLYLQKIWQKPRRFQRIKPLCYALFAGPGDELEALDIETARTRMEDHLFGDGEHGLVKVLGLVADLDGVTNWIDAPDEIATAQSAEQRRTRRLDAWKAKSQDNPDASSLDHAVPIEGFGLDDGGVPSADARSHSAADLLQTYAFQGVVSLQASALISCDVVFRAARGEVRPRSIPTRVHSGESDIDPAEIDSLLFADLCLAQCAPGDGARFVVTHVRYDTLAIPARRGRYLRALDQLDPTLSGSLILSVFGTPEHPDPYAARALVEHVRPYIRFLDWRVGRGSIDMDAMRHIAMHSITFDPALSGAAPDVERARFLTNISELHRFNVRAGVCGLETSNDIDLCHDAEVTYITGPAVTGQIAMPLPARRIDLRDLPLTDR